MKKMIVKPSTFELRFNRDDEHTKLLLDVLEDYIRTANYEDGQDEDIAVQKRISDIFFELKQSICCGDAVCYMNLYIMEAIEEIILRYRNHRKGEHMKCSQLWMYFRDARQKMDGISWGG